MSLRLSMVILLAFILSPICRAEQWEWRTPLQVQQIALATQLATFPLPQGALRSVLGRGKLPPLGGSKDDQNRVYGDIALTDPDSSGGYYVVRIFYDLTIKRAPEDIPITAAMILYFSPEKMTFAYEPEKALRNILPDIRKQMVERQLTPIGFAELFFKDGPSKTGANQPTRTTTMSTTPAAAQSTRRP